MKRKFLEDLGIEKEIIDKILDEAGKDLSNQRTEIESLTKEKESLTKQIGDRDKQLEELKKSSKDADALNKQIEQLQNDNKAAKESFDKEMKTLKVNNAVEIALTNAKAKNKIAVRALLKDLDKADFNDDGTIKGLGDQIKALTEADDSKFLFDVEQKPTFKGTNPAPSGDGELKGKTDTSNMTYSEMMNYLSQNPNAKL